MIKFKKPDSLSGKQLIDELNNANINASKCIIDGDGILWIDIESNQENLAKKIVESHVGVDVNVLKLKQKKELLQKLGITEDEAKLLLS